MELELKMQEIDCYESVHRITVKHEETVETAIPEYCLALARVVDTAGQLKIREKRISGSRLTVSGTVQVTVLYTSEECSGLRSLQLSVPFSCTADDERLRGSRSVCGCGRLQLVEARPITARKLYVRVAAEFSMEGLGMPACSVCGDVPDDPSLQVQREERTVRLLTGVLEREFNFQQECSPGPDGGIPEDLLLERLALRTTESRRLHQKLVINGELFASLLYRSTEQELQCCELVLPFSHVAEVAELPADAEYQPEVWILESGVRIVKNDGAAGFGLTARIGLLVKVYETRTLQYITDLYSTAGTADVEHRPCVLHLPRPTQVVRQEAAQTLELAGRQRPFACITALECGGTTVIPEVEGSAVHVDLHVQILYLDDTDTPVSTERSVELVLHTKGCPQSVRAICAPASVQVLANHCEIRLPVDFLLEQTEELRLDTVARAEVLALEGEAGPSVILRAVEEGDSIWEVAKKCRATVREIEAVNGLEAGAPLKKGILLIPRNKA